MGGRQGGEGRVKGCCPQEATGAQAAGPGGRCEGHTWRAGSLVFTASCQCSVGLLAAGHSLALLSMDGRRARAGVAGLA